MTYKERVAVIRQMGRMNPNLTDRELSIMIDAAFAKEDTPCER